MAKKKRKAKATGDIKPWKRAKMEKKASSREAKADNPIGLTSHVFFIGFMGAGKSSVARRIARFSKIASLDMDKYIARSQGKSIPEIFEEGGEALFREVETDALEQIANMDDPMLVSCGGGIVTTPKNLDILKRSGIVIHLQVDADEAASRISNTDNRPLFNDIESARKLCDSRLPLYEQAADIIVSTKGKSVGRIASEVMDVLKEQGILQSVNNKGNDDEVC